MEKQTRLMSPFPVNDTKQTRATATMSTEKICNVWVEN